MIEDYADRMPFTGTLKRFVVVPEPLKLSADEQRRLHVQLAEAMAAVASGCKVLDHRFASRSGLTSAMA